jgi:hypothetical protein
LKSVEEAQQHAELTSHSNFSESTEAVLTLLCSTCGKPCRSQTVSLRPMCCSNFRDLYFYGLDLVWCGDLASFTGLIWSGAVILPVLRA